MKKSYAKKLGLCVALALSVGVLLPTGMVEAKNYTTPITGNCIRILSPHLRWGTRWSRSFA